MYDSMDVAPSCTMPESSRWYEAIPRPSFVGLRMFAGLQSSTWNIVQMGVGLMLVFLAFFSQSFIEETVLSDRSKVDPSIAQDAGYVSQTIIYASFLCANLLAPPVVGFLGCRWSLLIGSATYTVLMAGFLFLNTPFLYFSSALEGIGSALLWTAVGHYLALNSNDHNIGRNSSVIWIWHTIGLIVGGIFLLAVFGLSPEPNLDIDVKTTRLLYGCFTAVALAGNVVFALLRTPKEEDEYRQRAGSYSDELFSTFRLFLTTDMLLLSVTSAFAGIEMSFWSEVYSTSLSFTKAFAVNTKALVAYNSIAIGVGQVGGSFLFGLYGDRTLRYGRWPLMVFSSALGCVACALTYLNLPGDANKHDTNAVSVIQPSIPIALFCGSIFGLVDACVNTQIYSLASVRWREATPQAFATSKFFHALLSAISMFYGGKFSLGWQLLLFAVTSILSTIAFTLVERRFHEAQKKLRSFTRDDEPESEAAEMVTAKVYT